MKKIIILLIILWVYRAPSFTQGIYNDAARIVSDAGSYWVVDNGNFIFTSRDATNPATIANLTINANASLIIEPQSFLSVSGILTNASGTDGLIIQSTSLGSGSLIHNTADIQGTIQQHIEAETWNLISSPFLQGSGTTARDLTPAGGSAYLRPYINGTAWGNYISEPDYQFVPSQGYALWLTLEKILGFSGLLMNGTISKPLVYGPANNWNLVGNPYPSALDWELVVRNNTSASMYLWENTYAGFNNGNYMTYNALSRIGVPASTTNIIPLFQGFFVETAGTGAFISFNNNARLHSNQPFYKDFTRQTQVLVRLKITDTQSRFDELLVCINPDANNNFDEFDSKKMSAESESPEIFSLAQNEKLVINAVQTLPIVIPVNIKATQAGTYTLKAFELMPDINTTIQLEDIQAGNMTDLRANDENTVDLLQGYNNNRFFLHFGRTNSIKEVENNTLYTLVYKHQIYIYTTDNKVIDQLSLYDISGRLITSQDCNSQRCLVNVAPLSNTVYIVKAMIGKEFVTKKVNVY